MRFIPIAEPIIGEREIAYVNEAVRSGWVSSIGSFIVRFEQAFADYVGTTYAIAVSNGTVGLHLVLHALGIGPGDEVLVPNLTFVATVHSVLQTGATPVLIDVEPDTWCIDPVSARLAITPQTKAIIPVHLYGNPADMGSISALAQEFGLLVIEDAAEAHGAEINGQRVGSLGNASVFSFYGNKIVTTGEGGMVTTNDIILAERLRYLKDHGMSPERRYYHTELAFNYRMTNLQAALGLAQMEQIEAFIACKREIACWYSQAFQDVENVQLPVERTGVRNVFWLFSLVLTGKYAHRRQEIGQALRRQGIDWRPFFEPMNRLPHLAHLRMVGRDGNVCPHSERLGASGLSLPSSCKLDKSVVDYISNAFTHIIS